MYKIKLLDYIYSFSKDSIILIFLFLFSLLPDFKFFNIKIWYIAIIVTFAYFFNNRKIKFPLCPVLVLIMWSIFVSITSGMLYFEIQRQLLNYLLAIPLICFSYSLVLNIGIHNAENCICIAALIYATSIVINTLIQSDIIKNYIIYSYLDHPDIVSLSNGGFNLDATWLAIYSGAFFNSKMKYCFFSLSLGISALYNCRIAMIIDVIIFLCFLYKGKYNKKLALSTLITFSFSMYLIKFYGLFDRIIYRMASIGNVNEPGSIGRIEMWKYVPNIIYEYPLGVGLGNSINALIRVTGHEYDDANLHNLIFEFLVQTGIIGCILYLILIAVFLNYFLKNRENLSVFSVMLLCYIVAGMVQFSGCESFVFLLIGAFWGSFIIKKQKNNGVFTQHIFR